MVLLLQPPKDWDFSRRRAVLRSAHCVLAVLRAVLPSGRASPLSGSSGRKQVDKGFWNPDKTLLFICSPKLLS
jgi:hypothetical protein